MDGWRQVCDVSAGCRQQQPQQQQQLLGRGRRCPNSLLLLLGLWLGSLDAGDYRSQRKKLFSMQVVVASRHTADDRASSRSEAGLSTDVRGLLSHAPSRAASQLQRQVALSSGNWPPRTNKMSIYLPLRGRFTTNRCRWKNVGRRSVGAGWSTRPCGRWSREDGERKARQHGVKEADSVV